jgi:sugar-specific transcriptional regulator TrmB
MVVSTYTDQFFDMDEVGTLILDELNAGLERGVEVRLLMRPDLVPLLPQTIGERYRESLTDHERFLVRTNENVSGTFTLVDENEVVIEVPHPLQSKEVFGVIDLKDPEFVRSIREEFEPRWSEADPLSF